MKTITIYLKGIVIQSGQAAWSASLRYGLNEKNIHGSSYRASCPAIEMDGFKKAIDLICKEPCHIVLKTHSQHFKFYIDDINGDGKTRFADLPDLMYIVQKIKHFGHTIEYQWIPSKIKDDPDNLILDNLKKESFIIAQQIADNRRRLN